MDSDGPSSSHTWWGRKKEGQGCSTLPEYLQHKHVKNSIHVYAQSLFILLIIHTLNMHKLNIHMLNIHMLNIHKLIQYIIIHS